MIEFMYPAPWPQWLPRGSNFEVAKLSFKIVKFKKTLKLGHVIGVLCSDRLIIKNMLYHLSLNVQK